MNERDDWLLKLYEGRGEARLPEDPGPAGEEAAFREMKTLLDARPGRKPDARTVSAVLKAARGDAAPVGARLDRAPVRRTRTVGLRVGAASAVVVALIAAVGVLSMDVFSPDEAQMPAPSIEATPQASERAADAGETPPGAARASSAAVQHTPALQDEPADEMLTPVDTAAGAFALAASERDPALTWDERNEVIELHQRIERIGAGTDRDWGAPPIPLETLPSGQGTGVVPVGQWR